MSLGTFILNSVTIPLQPAPPEAERLGPAAPPGNHLHGRFLSLLGVGVAADAPPFTKANSAVGRKMMTPFSRELLICHWFCV